MKIKWEAVWFVTKVFFKCFCIAIRILITRMKYPVEFKKWAMNISYEPRVEGAIKASVKRHFYKGE